MSHVIKLFALALIPCEKVTTRSTTFLTIWWSLQHRYLPKYLQLHIMALTHWRVYVENLCTYNYQARISTSSFPFSSHHWSSQLQKKSKEYTMYKKNMPGSMSGLWVKLFGFSCANASFPNDANKFDKYTPISIYVATQYRIHTRHHRLILQGVEIRPGSRPQVFELLGMICDTYILHDFWIRPFARKKIRCWTS